MPIEQFSQGYGVEIELYLPEGGSMHGLCMAVAQRIGRPCQTEGYNHQRRSHWKCVTDASLGDLSRGAELVSPILRGPEGIAEVEKVVKAAADYGCTVGKKCGFHIHVGSANLIDAGETIEPLGFTKRLINIYAGFEQVIDSLMPPSRRKSANQFCKSITAALPTALNATRSLDELSAIATPGYSDNRRFYKVNIVAYNRHKTIEFRQHSATLDPNKVRCWILTVLRLVAAAKNGAAINPGAPVVAQTALPSAVQGVINQAREGTKTWRVGQMMLRPEGATGPEACAEVGWPTISMPQQAQMCGLTVTTQRIGRTVRYFARAAQAEIAATPPAPQTLPTPITLIGFMDLIGSSPDEREYLLQRQTDLGGPIAWAA